VISAFNKAIFLYKAPQKEFNIIFILIYRA